MTDDKGRRQEPDGSETPAGDTPIKKKAGPAAVADQEERRENDQSNTFLLAVFCNVLDNCEVDSYTLHDLPDADFLRTLYNADLQNKINGYLNRIAKAFDSAGNDDEVQQYMKIIIQHLQTDEGQAQAREFILLWRSMRRVQMQFEGAGLIEEEIELAAYILYLLEIDPANPNGSGQPLTLEDLRRLRGMEEVKKKPALLQEIEESWIVFADTGEWTGPLAIGKKPATDEKIRPRARKEREAGQLSEIVPVGSIPNGAAVNFLFRVFNSSKNKRVIRSSPKNRHETITAQQNGDMMRFIQENKQAGTTTIVVIEQADKYLNKTNKTFTKVLLFTLQKMTAQNFPLELDIGLQELVDLGMYSTTSNAARAMRDFYFQQKQITISGVTKKGRRIIEEQGGQLFYNYKIHRGKGGGGYITLSVNEHFNFEFIAPYFTAFPRFAYALSNNAFSLVRYVFFLARQRTEDIKNKGHFTVNLDSVREHLGLPSVDEVNNRKYRQYIIEPIEKAINEIEEAIIKAPEIKEHDEFMITPCVVDDGNIKTWLNGYLEIRLSGTFADTFVSIATKAEKNRAQWEKVKAAELARIAARAELKEGQEQPEQSTKKRRAKAQK